MTQFVVWLLRASLWGSVSAVGVWAVCGILRRLRTPGRWLCWLWLAVAVRYVWPQGLRVTVPRPQSEPLLRLDTAVREFSPALTTPSTAAPVQKTAGMDWATVVFVVWLAGAVFLAVRAAWRYAGLRHSVATACKGPDGCYGGVPVPFTLGVVRPLIFLPDSLTGEARAAVLCHEQAHIRRGDTLTKPLFYAVACLHWFNPAAWLAFRQFERCMEDACDEAAVHSRTARQRAAYGETLLQFAVRGSSVPGSLSFGQGSVRRRVAHLLRYHRPGRAALAACAVVTALCATACMVRPEAAPPAPAVEEVVSVPEPTPSPTPVSTSTPEQTLMDMSGYFSCPVPDFKYISRYMAKDHRGDDYAADHGTEVHAAADGTVVIAEYHYSFGYYVMIDHGTTPDGATWQTLYAHLAEEPIVKEGDPVTRGQIIGGVGSTGMSTGNHLHFEVRRDGQVLPPRWFTREADGTAPLPLTEEQAAALLARETIS